MFDEVDVELERGGDGRGNGTWDGKLYRVHTPHDVAKELPAAGEGALSGVIALCWVGWPGSRGADIPSNTDLIGCKGIYPSPTIHLTPSRVWLGQLRTSSNDISN